MPLQGIPKTEFARREGCSHTLVYNAVKTGHLPALDDGSMDPNLVGTPWRATNRKKSREEETPREAAERIVVEEGRAPFTLAEAERIKENYLALLRQLEYDKESGAVVAIEDVVAAIVSEYAIIRNRLLNIPSRIAPRVAAIRSPEEVQATIHEEIAQVLEELSLDGHGSTPADELQRSVQARIGKAPRRAKKGTD